MRLGQDPDLAFAPAPLASLEFGQDGAPPRLQVRLFGLLGPNGPLPIHITEYARHRLRHAGDPTLSRFLDLLHHRFIALFYRAWAQAQPHVNRDRPDRIATWSTSARSSASRRRRCGDRDTVPDLARLFHAGTLVRQVRNADGLAAILRQFFRVPATIEEFVGHWLRLGAARAHAICAATAATLGGGAVLGRPRLGPSEQVPHSPRPADAGAVRSVSAGDAATGSAPKAGSAAPEARRLGAVLSLFRARLGRPPAPEARRGAAL